MNLLKKSRRIRCFFIKFFMILMTILSLFQFIKNVYFFISSESFNILKISDYFINYSSGFIRRGIDGQLIYYISKYTNFEPIVLIKLEYSIYLSIFLILMLPVLLKNKLSILYLLSPLMFFSALINFSSFHLAKDIMLMVFYIFLIYSTKHIKNEIIKYSLVNILIIFCLLSHEVFLIFLFFPYILLVYNRINIKNILKMVLILLPSIIVFCLLIIVYNGLNNDINSIYLSWYSLSKKTMGLSFNAGLFDGNFSSRYIWNNLGHKWYNWIGFVLNLLLNFLFILSFIKLYDLKNEKEYIILILIQLIIILSLSVVASDFGRWVLLNNFFTLALIIFQNKNKLFLNKNKLYWLYFGIFLIVISGLPYATYWSIHYYLPTNYIFYILNL